jgi:hypothetical protein
MTRRNAYLGIVVFLFLITVPTLTAEARYYQPTMGRWVSRDPIGYAAGLNLYEYVSSRCTSLIDPMGTENTGMGMRGPMAISRKQIWNWQDFVAKPGANPNWKSNWEQVSQSVDFQLGIDHRDTITISLIGATDVPEMPGGPIPADEGTLTFEISWFAYEMPTVNTISQAVEKYRGAAKALVGKVCRKVVFVRQSCCVKIDGSADDPDAKRTIRNKYAEVRLYGEINIPGNSLPAVAECDVSKAEERLRDIVDQRNSENYDMCSKKGLNMSREKYLGYTKELLDKVPDINEAYVPGVHKPLTLFLDNQYPKGNGNN